MNEETVKKVLKALSDARLVVCEESLIGPEHPGLCDSDEYIIGRIEESGGFGTD